MPYLQAFGVMTVVTALVAAPALAQPAAPTATPPATAVPGVVATTNNPNLAVATVKLENGNRVSKVIGSAVYGDGNQQIGSIDDLIVTDGDKVTVAIVSVGGFLGMGAKLIAFPYGQLKWDGQRVTLPGATKDTLNAMPSFQY